MMMTDVSQAPVFRPTSYVFNPTPAQTKPMPKMQMAAAYNMSDYGHSTNASSSQNRSDTSAEFLPYPYTTKAAPTTPKLLELPQEMA